MTQSMSSKRAGPNRGGWKTCSRGHNFRWPGREANAAAREAARGAKAKA
jgi:hypothetical protein